MALFWKMMHKLNPMYPIKRLGIRIVPIVHIEQEKEGLRLPP